MLETRSFSELSSLELHDIFVLRQKVFVVEQDCPYLDADGMDLHSFHIFKRCEEGTIFAYARVLPPGQLYDDYAVIGRVAVDESFRAKGYGKELMNESVRFCQKYFHDTAIKISAQSYLKKFYSDLGFNTIGDEYLEDGIPHLAMIKKIKI